MSEKNDGNMKINHDGEKSTNPNRRRFFKKKGIPEENVISALLHHGHEVSIVGHNSSREFIPKTDALVTVIKGTYLSITNADCFPIFFFDPIGEVVGLAHAGWKGITTNIIPITIGKMTVAGSDIENLRVIIGPGICHDCFEFGLKDAKSNFGKYYDRKYMPAVMEGKVCVSLRGIIVDQLIRIGVKSHRINISESCTHCDSERFFSARRDRKGDTDSPIDCMISIIGMKPD